MALIYHSFLSKNADGKFIAPGQKCFTPTAQCFWKDPKDICCWVKTRNQSSNQHTVSTGDYEQYFLKKQRIEQLISGREMFTTKASDRFFIV